MITLSNITLATDNMVAMTAFYDAVFNTNLKPKELFPGAECQIGTLANMQFVIVPNALAQVKAEQNRFQLQFTVDNTQAMVDAALANGGTLLDAVNDAGVGSVYDPDGNSIVFVQATNQNAP